MNKDKPTGGAAGLASTKTPTSTNIPMSKDGSTGGAASIANTKNENTKPIQNRSLNIIHWGLKKAGKTSMLWALVYLMVQKQNAGHEISIDKVAEGTATSEKFEDWKEECEKFLNEAHEQINFIQLPDPTSPILEQNTGPVQDEKYEIFPLSVKYNDEQYFFNFYEIPGETFIRERYRNLPKMSNTFRGVLGKDNTILIVTIDPTGADGNQSEAFRSFVRNEALSGKPILVVLTKLDKFQDNHPKNPNNTIIPIGMKNINQKSDKDFIFGTKAEQIRQELYKDPNSILFPYINALEQIDHNAALAILPYSLVNDKRAIESIQGEDQEEKYYIINHSAVNMKPTQELLDWICYLYDKMIRTV